MTRNTQQDAPAMALPQSIHPSMVGRGMVDLRTKRGFFYTEKPVLLIDAKYYFGKYTGIEESASGSYVVVPVIVSTRSMEAGKSVMRFAVAGQPEFFEEQDAFFKWQTETLRKAMGK